VAVRRGRVARLRSTASWLVGGNPERLNGQLPDALSGPARGESPPGPLIAEHAVLDKFGFQTAGSGEQVRVPAARRGRFNVVQIVIGEKQRRGWKAEPALRNLVN